MKSTCSLHNIHCRRARLGLAIHGPFNRNRRRRPFRTSLKERSPALLAATLFTLAATFLFFLFR